MANDIEIQHDGFSQHEANEDKNYLTESEWTNLRRIPDSLPKIALLILVVEVNRTAP